MGVPVPTYEMPARAERIRAALGADGRFAFVGPTDHGRAPIDAVHNPGLVDFLERAWPEIHAATGRDELTPDVMLHAGLRAGMGAGPAPADAVAAFGYWCYETSTALVAGTYEAARASVDVALTAGDLVLGGERFAYGLCRPPGHHAARDVYGGFCFFNNAAILADHLVRATGAKVTVLDVDYHHGNGTQQIFWRRSDVLYASLHADPRRLYPFFLGHADEIGEGEGRGANLNLPQPLRADDSTYLADLDRALEWIDASAGAIVVVSLGFDTYERDPIGDLALTTAGYHEMGRRVGALGRRLVILQEGGYFVPDLGANAVAWLRGAAGRPPAG